ncbi:MAG: hypothetical protein U9R32_01185 [Bacteroidota bacterium]|nr:hypothetical protein [Bacteroidota bacterium]
MFRLFIENQVTNLGIVEIKYFIGKYLLKRKLKKASVCNKFVSLDEVKSICMILSIDDKPSQKIFNEIRSVFKPDINVDIIGIQCYDSLPVDFVASKYNIVSSSDFNFFYKLKDHVCKKISGDKYDVLLHYSATNHLQSHFISTLIKADSKISNCEIQDASPYNIILHTKGDSDFYFVEQAKHYLESIIR